MGNSELFKENPLFAKSNFFSINSLRNLNTPDREIPVSFVTLEILQFMFFQPAEFAQLSKYRNKYLAIGEILFSASARCAHLKTSI